MGFFDDIMSAVFGGPAKASETSAPVPPPATTAPGGASPKVGSPAAAPAANVDVAAILDAAVTRSGQKLDWRKSIVDLMKALGIDSSLTARKALAAELAYPGDTSDSAAMNVWLHQQVIQKLRDNGGKVPASLLD